MSLASTAQVVEPADQVDGAPGIYDVLVAAAAADPDHVFLRDGDQELTYGDLIRRADREATRLVDLGLGAGSRVVLWLPNGGDFAALFFACARAGMVAVMAAPRLRALDVRHILADSQADALVFAPRFLRADYDVMVQTAVRGDGTASPHLVHLLATQPSVAPGARCLDDLPARTTPPVFRNADAPAVVSYTSGTTDQPKACIHSHSALIRNGSVAVRLTGLARGDRIVCPVPFAHIFGFHMGLLQTALAGATLVNAEPYDAGRLLDIAESAEATVLYAVPTMAREALVAQRARPRDLRRLRIALIAGAPVSSGLRTALRAPSGLDCDVSVVYGCTEAPTLTQLVPGDPPAQALGSVGRATNGVELRIIGAGTSNPLPAGEVGEIAVRGYNCMLGYLDDPVATEAKYRNGWLVTGDLGSLDGDSYLHVVGRASEVFPVGGCNAYPHEIEAELEVLQGVAEVAVVGVPDDRLGWVPMAWVVAEDAHLGESEVLTWARSELASCKRPRYARVVQALPRTANGKLSRVKLAQLARRALPHLPWEGRDS